MSETKKLERALRTMSRPEMQAEHYRLHALLASERNPAKLSSLSARVKLVTDKHYRLFGVPIVG